MDKYLTNEKRLNMFNRLVNHNGDIENVEEFIKTFFDLIIPIIERKVYQPYTLFKNLQKSVKDKFSRYTLFQEIGFYYIEDEDPYISFSDKKNLNSFLKLIDEEELRLSDDLGIMLNREDLVRCFLLDIKKDLDEIPTLLGKRDFLLKEKLECITRQNQDAVEAIDELLYVIEEQLENEMVYVDTMRTNELERINSSKFDLIKIIQVCNELNHAYREKNYISIPLLVRTLIDHIPPIFGKQNFNEVVSQCGNKSFKESMSHLDKSLRKIADALLHNQIRNKEILPNHTQIDFKADIDILLAEVCRKLK